MKPKISAFILTKNSERQLEAALNSVKWADEIIINDGYSTDKTLEICKRYGAKVYQRKFEGYHNERNFSISKCTGDWIVELDSDEVLDKDLQKNIKEMVKNPKYDVYKIKRKDYWMNNHLITLRLARVYKNGAVKYEGCTHEMPVYIGKAGILDGYCIHDPEGDGRELYGFVRQVEGAVNLEIRKRFPPEGKQSISKASIIFKMFFEPIKIFFGLLFYKGLIFKGLTAYIWVCNAVFYEFTVYAKAYEEFHLKPQHIKHLKK